MAMKVTDQKLRKGETSSCNQTGGQTPTYRANRPAPPPAKRHEHRKNRELSADHRAKRLQIQIRDFGQSQKRCAKAPKATGRYSQSKQVWPPQADEIPTDHQAPEIATGAESGCPLNERAEAESYQQGLDATVARHAGNFVLQPSELPVSTDRS